MDTLNKQPTNSTLKKIFNHLREAYSLAICSNGPWSDPDDRSMIWDEFNRFANKVLYKK